jgi:hypothetical protein
MPTTAVTQVWRPSAARMVAFDGPLPLPRGVLPSDLPPLAWPAKDPADVLDYAIDTSALLAGDDSDRIATVGVNIVPNASNADLRLGNIVADSKTVVIWLSAGQAGTVYSVQVTIGTLNGRLIGRTVLLPVQALATVAPPTTVLTTETGAVVTDQHGNPILIGS